MDYTKDNTQQPNQPNDFDPNAVKSAAQPVHSAAIQDANKKGSFQLILTITIILAVCSFIPFLGFLSLPALAMSIWILSRKQWGYGILTLILSGIGLATSPLVLVFIGCLFTDCKGAIEDGMKESFDKEVDESGKVTYKLKKTDQVTPTDSGALFQVLKEGEVTRKTSEYYVLVEEPIISDKENTEKIKDYSSQMCKSATSEFCEVYSWESIKVKDFTEITPEVKKNSHGKYSSFDDSFSYFKFGTVEPMGGSQEKWQLMAPGIRYIGGIVSEQKPYVVHIYIDNEKLKNSNIQELDSFGMKKDETGIKTGIAETACKKSDNCIAYFYYDKDTFSKVSTEIDAMQQSAGYYKKQDGGSTSIFKN